MIIGSLLPIIDLANNRTVRVKQLCMKTTPLSSHRFLIKTAVEKPNNT